MISQDWSLIFITLVPTWICQMTYYHSDPCLVGIGLSAQNIIVNYWLKFEFSPIIQWSNCHKLVKLTAVNFKKIDTIFYAIFYAIIWSNCRPFSKLFQLIELWIKVCAFDLVLKKAQKYNYIHGFRVANTLLFVKDIL